MFLRLFNHLKKSYLEILPFILVFLASLYRPYDSDLGWHLKYGEYFFKTGQILKDNIFSTEMTGYKWVNHSWATDLLTYLSFNTLGFLGITLLGATVICLTFYFFSRAAKLDLWEKAFIFPLVLYFTSAVNMVSFRGQLLSYLFLGILFYLLTFFESASKKGFFLILLFLLWANFHGGFLIGLVFFGGFIVLELFKDVLESGIKDWKRIISEKKKLIFLFIASSLVTILNPWGVGIYYEAYKHSTDPSLQLVKEWLPFEDLTTPWWNLYIAGILVFFGSVFYFFYGLIKEKLSGLGLTFGLLFASIWVRRHAWPFYYLSMDAIKPIVGFFKPESEKIAQNSAAIVLLLSIALVSYMKWPFGQFSQMNWDIYCQEFNSCTKGGAQFLIENNLNDNLFTLYNWGGWLIWNYPEVKPPVDGRMHLWRDHQGFSAFEFFYKYEQDLESIDESKWDVAFVPPSKNVYQRLEKLMKAGKWKRVYRDEFSAVFVRIKGQN